MFRTSEKWVSEKLLSAFLGFPALWQFNESGTPGYPSISPFPPFLPLPRPFSLATARICGPAADRVVIVFCNWHRWPAGARTRTRSDY